MNRTSDICTIPDYIARYYLLDEKLTMPKGRTLNNKTIHMYGFTRRVMLKLNSMEESWREATDDISCSTLNSSLFETRFLPLCTILDYKALPRALSAYLVRAIARTGLSNRSGRDEQSCPVMRSTAKPKVPGQYQVSENVANFLSFMRSRLLKGASASWPRPSD